MLAKPVKPGTFHDCKSCEGKMMPGSPTRIDGWVDKDKDYFGSIEEYPDFETANDSMNPDYRPPERLVADRCYNGCSIPVAESEANFSIYEVWMCGRCGDKFKSLDAAGECCV